MRIGDHANAACRHRGPVPPILHPTPAPPLPPRAPTPIPGLVHHGWNIRRAAALPGPPDHVRVSGRGGAQPRRIRCGAHPPEVQSVRIPAGLDRDVGVEQSLGVVGTGSVKKRELGIGEMNQRAPEGGREGRAPPSVARVDPSFRRRASHSTANNSTTAG